MRYALLSLGLAGCGLMPPNYADMTKGQIDAAKEKNTGIACLTIKGAGFQSEFAFLNLEKIYGTGGGDVSVKCAGADIMSKDMGKAKAAATGGPTQ